MKAKNLSKLIICAGLLAFMSRLPMLSAALSEEDINSKNAEKISRLQKMDYKQAIKKIKTPKEAEWYIRHYIIQKDDAADVAKSFRVLHETRGGDCSEGVVAAAALLSDNGYPPTWLFLEGNNDWENHGVFLYKKNEKWGTIGINALDNNPAKYSTLDEIAKHLGYDRCELKELKETNSDSWTSWIDSRRDLYGTGRVLLEK